MTSKVLVEIKAPVATITLNKPERLNAVDVEVWEGIREAAIAVDAAPGVRAVILEGAGGAFCAGLDVKAGSNVIVARVDPTVRAKLHDKMRLSLHPERVHFFDQKTELAI